MLCLGEKCDTITKDMPWGLGTVRESKWKIGLTDHVGEFLAALLLIQPLLDVLSYFLLQAGSTGVTSGLRMVMLAAVCVYGFLITEHKEIYLLAGGVVAFFWLLHMLNCFRIGYAQPVSDTAQYLRLVQFPLWTICFITFFRAREGLDLTVTGVLSGNMAIILLVIGLSFLSGHPVYTYGETVRLGLLGWFGVPSAQCAVVCLLAPAALLWALRSESLPLFSVVCLLVFGLLFFTGTRMTYYTAVLLCAVFAVMVAVCKKPFAFCAPLLVCLALLVACRGLSPMAQRRELMGIHSQEYQQRIDQIMGEDGGYDYSREKEIDPVALEKIRTVYTELYGQTGLYGEVLLEDLVERFGADAVMEELHYSISPSVLNETRNRRIAAMDLVWNEKDGLTHLLGMEYAECFIGENNYDPENDLPAVLYYTGYLGTALYGAFVLGLFVYAAAAFFRRFPALLETEFLTAGVVVVLALGAAQFSGNVLRRPNVNVYLSLAAAKLFYAAWGSPMPTRIRRNYQRNPAVTIKKIQ